MQKNIDWFSEAAERSELLSWSEIKMRLKGKSEKELISLLSDCYKLSPDVKVKLSLAVSENKTETSKIILELKKRLHKIFWTYEKNGCPKNPDLKEANKIISLAKSATDDKNLLLDLMLDHFQHGIDFTMKLGDLWDAYYGSIERMFQKTCDLIIDHRSEIDLDNTLKRIDENIEKTELIGWGFHDNLVEMREELKEKLGEKFHG
jgi:hypothetical protein